MKRELFANVVVFTVVLALGAFILLYGYMGLRPGTGYTRLTLQLAYSGQLSPGSPVLLRGVRIGDVSTVSPGMNGVDVAVRYDADYRIPQDSALSIEQLSALGEPYLEIAPRSSGGPLLHDGQVIAASRVLQPRPITEVFASLAAINKMADSGAIAGLVDTAWTATTGRDDDLRTLSGAGRLLSSTVLSRMPEIRRMFADTQTYSADLAWAPRALSRLGTEFDRTATVVRSAVEAVQRMVTELNAPDPFTDTIDPFLQRLTPYLEEIVTETAAAGSPFFEIIAAANRTVPHIDLSTLLSNALQLAGSDGTAHVTITLPRP